MGMILCAKRGVAIVVGAVFFGHFGDVAEASLVKGEGSPPLVMPNTLLVEAGEPLGDGLPRATASKMGRAVADTKRSPRTCAAAAVRFPQGVARIVTARHCADHRRLAVLDNEHQVTPVREIDADGDVDLSLLEVAGPLPWAGLEAAPSSSAAPGDRLCAWHMWRTEAGIERERICARLLRREERKGAEPLLVMSHPYPAGTSGSALVDRRGRAVGIVVASNGFSGLAEPIEEAWKLPRRSGPQSFR